MPPASAKTTVYVNISDYLVLYQLTQVFHLISVRFPSDICECISTYAPIGLTPLVYNFITVTLKRIYYIYS
jgi:hypothetical protein